jgi:uncharacterized repeat protein (TIGR03847 family)
VNSQRLDLGRVDDIHVESFGEPGQRTFRLRIVSGAGEVSLWIEKFQVVMLGSALTELLQSTRPGTPVHADRPELSFMGELAARVGALAIAYVEEDRVFLIEATELDSPFDLEIIAFQVDREMIQTMNDEIEQLVAASRPRCVLCGTPLTGEPHFCPQQNGHAKPRADEPT